jgi:hypothetical protein
MAGCFYVSSEVQKMRKFKMFLICSGLALPLMAQNETTRLQGYGYFGVLGADHTTFGKLLNPGLGAELTLYKGFAASADIGYVGFYNNFNEGGFGLFSPNLTYRFFNSSNFVPFVTGGYSRIFRDGSANLGNYGGGVTYWLRRRVGLRVEGRDYRDTHGYHFGGVRLGVSFR